MAPADSQFPIQQSLFPFFASEQGSANMFSKVQIVNIFGFVGTYIAILNAIT